MTDKAMTQAQINDACEKLLDEVEETSALQARILRAYYRDNLSLFAISKLLRKPEHRIHLEMVAGLKTLVSLLTGGDRLIEWNCERDTGPEPGESANKVEKPKKKAANKAADKSDAGKGE